MLWGVLSVLLLAAFVAAVALLAWFVSAGIAAVRRATGEAAGQLARELALLDADQLRTRLVQDEYLRRLRRSSGVNAFMSALEKGEEVRLAAEYRGKRLYRLLVRAEREMGSTGRPEAVDACGDISAVLHELASRGRG
jgi:hypothetical protein